MTPNALRIHRERNVERKNRTAAEAFECPTSEYCMYTLSRIVCRTQLPPKQESVITKRRSGVESELFRPVSLIGGGVMMRGGMNVVQSSSKCALWSQPILDKDIAGT